MMLIFRYVLRVLIQKRFSCEIACMLLLISDDFAIFSFSSTFCYINQPKNLIKLWLKSLHTWKYACPWSTHPTATSEPPSCPSRENPNPTYPNVRTWTSNVISCLLIVQSNRKSLLRSTDRSHDIEWTGTIVVKHSTRKNITNGDDVSVILVMIDIFENMVRFRFLLYILFRYLQFW